MKKLIILALYLSSCASQGLYTSKQGKNWAKVVLIEKKKNYTLVYARYSYSWYRKSFTLLPDSIHVGKCVDTYNYIKYR